MSGQVWVWVGLLWTDRVQAVLDEYGDRLTDVSIFGWSVDQDGSLHRTFNPQLLDTYRQKWPHIRWWACFRNMEAPSGASAYQVWQALRFTPAVRNKLSTDLQSLISDYPWIYGVDIDLEGGGDLYSAESEEVFRQIAATVRSTGRKISAALPALTATGSVGGENWVRYKQLGQILDHVSIMSYDMAWNGSAPGPISPGFWMRDVYAWASSQIPPKKISMGLPAYARAWHISDVPSGPYRGQSSNYYGMRNYLDGTWSAGQDETQQPNVAWLAYRDPDGMAPWAFLGVYDWHLPSTRTDSQGVIFGSYGGKDYFTRPGMAAGNPLWSVADQSIGSQRATFGFRPQLVRDVNGAWVGPRIGFNLTVEILRRRAESALILDDDCRTSGQMARLYSSSGSWSQWHEQSPVGDRAETGQYRVGESGGSLRYGNNFGDQALHLVARAQLPASGRWGVTIGKVRVDVNQAGNLRIVEDGAVRAQTTIDAPGVSSQPGQGRVVIGIRVRGTHVRAYASNALTSVPLRLEADVSASSLDGTAGAWASGSAWFDYLRLGDGWWFQPQEAIEVVSGNQTWLLGRDPRTGVQWDTATNRFRPTADVEESQTLTLPTSLDWDFVHIKNFPAPIGQSTQVRVRPVDINTWIGRLLLCDREGAQLAYYADVEYLAHWQDQAKFTWGLQGIAMWTLGQEDIRFWERIKGGATASLHF